MAATEGVLLGNAGDREGLAGESSGEQIVGRDLGGVDQVDVAEGSFAEPFFIRLPGIAVPLARETASAAKLLKGDAEAADAGEQIDEGEGGQRLSSYPKRVLGLAVRGTCKAEPHDITFKAGSSRTSANNLIQPERGSFAMRLKLLIAGLSCLLGSSAWAQTPDLAVTGASCARPGSGNAAAKVCRLGDTVTVTFSNLDEWIKADAKHDPAQIMIALNDHAIPGTHANVMIANRNALTFDMTEPEGTDADALANQQAWRAILRRLHSPTTMLLSVGLKGGTFYGPAKLTFQLYPNYAGLVFGVMGVLFAAVAWLATKSGLIRASGPAPGPGKERPYSLGRMQMAWWFVLVVGAYLYIWLITDNINSLTTGVLILTGISAATGLGSQVAGGGTSSPRAPAPGTIPDPNTPDPSAPALTAPVLSAPVQATAGPASRGFLNDILGDQNGISFDRFQMAAWTLVLGLVFTMEVLRDLSMPDFSPTLLGLMGISSGTYVGFKLPGKNS